MPVLQNRYQRAWPSDGAESVTYLPLSEVLTRAFDTDAHFVQYFYPSHPYRLRRDAYDHLPAPPAMSLVVFDVDEREAHRTGEAASDAWFADEEDKLCRMLAAHRGGYIYRTRGGYRVVYLAPAGTVIASEQAALAWRRQYVSAAVYLAERFGIVIDPTCKPWAWLFRAPHATRTDGRPEARQAFGEPKAVGVWSHSPGDPQRERKVAEHLAQQYPTWRNAVAEYRRVLAKKSRSRTRTAPTVSTRQLAAAEYEELAVALAELISRLSDGRHRLYLALSAALLSRGVASDVLPAVVRRVAELACDAKVARRANDAQSTARAWSRGAPTIGYTTLRLEWPDVAAALDARLPPPAIASPPPPTSGQEAPPASLADVMPELRRRVEEALSRDALTVISVPPGVGKSREALAAAMRSEKRVAFAHPTNAVARAQYALGAGIDPDRVARRYGVLAAVDDRGAPLCKKVDLARTIQAGGMPVPQRLCIRCEHRDGCRARAGREGASRASVLVMNHAMLDKAIEDAGTKGVLVIDELPPAFAHHEFSGAEMGTLYGTCFVAFARGFATPASGILELLADAGRAAQDGEDLLASLERVAPARESDSVWEYRLAAMLVALPSGKDPDLDNFDQPRPAERPDVSGGYFDRALAIFVAASRCWPNHAVPPTTKDTSRDLATARVNARTLATASRALGVLRRVLDPDTCGGRHALARWKVDDQGGVSLEVTEVQPALRRALEREGPTVILDATPDLAAVRAVSPRSVDVYQRAVADGAPVRRTLVYTRLGAKSRLAPYSGVDWARFGALASESLIAAAATAGKNVLLITHKPCADGLREYGDEVPHERLADILRRRRRVGARTAIAHYGDVKGKNEFDGLTWRDLDAVVTVGDPWPDIGRAARENELLGLTDDDAARRIERLVSAELAQAHGRLRAPRQTKAVCAVHVGQLFPLDWHDGNCTVTTTPDGRPPKCSSMTIDDLQQRVNLAGGRRALARRVGCAESTIRRYLAGRAIPQEFAAKLQEVSDRA